MDGGQKKDDEEETEGAVLMTELGPLDLDKPLDVRGFALACELVLREAVVVKAVLEAPR